MCPAFAFAKWLVVFAHCRCVSADESTVIWRRSPSFSSGSGSSAGVLKESDHLYSPSSFITLRLSVPIVPTISQSSLLMLAKPYPKSQSVELGNLFLPSLKLKQALVSSYLPVALSRGGYSVTVCTATVLMSCRMPSLLPIVIEP